MNLEKFSLGLGLLCCLAAGCAVGPDYARPTVPSQTGWKEGGTATNTSVLPSQWWEIFHDPALSALETKAAASNQDLKRAVARVTEARALSRVSASALYPSIGANAAYSRNRFSENQAGFPRQDMETDDYSASFDLSYELDVWGRVRRSMEAARADAAAVATDLEVVLLTLSADVARQYFQLRSLDNERLVVEATVDLRQDALRLQETRFQAGLINEVDVSRARTELANVEADLHAIARSRAQAEHALAVLCGEPPGQFSVAVLASSLIVPQVPAGLPSTLLQRRPDLVEAELGLQAASARIGVAKAAFYPTIKLTGTAGLATADLGTFLTWPSKVWSVGPSIHFPIFEGGRNRANLEATKAQYEESVAAYRGTVLNALREVEDALSDLGSLARQSEAVDRALRAARDTSNLADDRYQRGLSNYLDVVDAQRAAFDAEREAIQLSGQRAASTILLIKALGGGWEAPAPEVKQLAAK